MRRLSIFLPLCLFASSIGAQESLPSQAHSWATGQSIYYESATRFAPSLFHDEGSSLGLTYSHPYWARELHSSSLSATLRRHRIRSGFSLSHFGYHHYYQGDVSACGAIRLHEHYSLGTSLRYQLLVYTGMTHPLHQLSFSLDNEWHVRRVDLYLQWKQHLISSDKVDNRPHSFSLDGGIHWQIGLVAQGCLEGGYDSSLRGSGIQPWSLRTGWVYDLLPLDTNRRYGFRLLAGCSLGPLRPSWGAEFHSVHWSLCVADNWLPNVAHSLSISFTIQ